MKNKDFFMRTSYLITGTIVVIAIIILINSFRPSRDQKAVSVGAVFIGSFDDDGWNESHFEGIKKACDEQSCELYVKFDVPEEKESFDIAVNDLISHGCSCIFLTSYGYGAFVDEMAKKNPKVAFFDVSGEAEAKNGMSYFARMYQVRYLSGIVAGAATKSNILGYITAVPVPETIRSVNAYAMGARKANPDAKVLVRYTGSWDDRKAEEGAVYDLSRAGADVITFHEDRAYALDLADELGLYSTGYNYVYREYSDRMLTAALINWDVIYQTVLNDYLSGRADFSKNYWLGTMDKAVSLYPYSDLVTQDTKYLVAFEEERIKSWRDVFSGEIYDSNGTMRCGKDERISDEELFYEMDWYVEGVEIYE